VSALLIALIALVCIGLLVLVGYDTQRRWHVFDFAQSSERGLPSPDVVFQFLDKGLGTAPTPGPRQRDTKQRPPTAGGDAQFVFQTKASNPDAYCLRTGSQVRDCTCLVHRARN
jgi:hypothetical protein